MCFPSFYFPEVLEDVDQSTVFACWQWRITRIIASIDPWSVVKLMKCVKYQGLCGVTVLTYFSVSSISSHPFFFYIHVTIYRRLALSN
jgi:hypothetical protein